VQASNEVVCVDTNVYTSARVCVFVCNGLSSVCLSLFTFGYPHTARLPLHHPHTARVSLVPRGTGYWQREHNLVLFITRPFIQCCNTFILDLPVWVYTRTGAGTAAG
jgi:hypothetical protein